MRTIIFLTLFLVASNTASAQQTLPTLLLDGLPTESVYTDSLGILSLGGNSAYQIHSISITLNDDTKNALKRLNAADGTAGRLIRLAPPGSKVTIRAFIGCTNCISMQVTAIYYAP